MESDVKNIGVAWRTQKSRMYTYFKEIPDSDKREFSAQEKTLVNNFYLIYSFFADCRISSKV